MKKSSIIVGLILSVSAIASAIAKDEMILPPNAKIAGISQAKWSAMWWQWAASFDRSESPVADSTGEKCNQKQSGPVWFLAGTYGSNRTIRSCRIPHGKYLFFPLINVMYMRGTDKTCDCSCNSLKSASKSDIDENSMLVLDIDGHRVENLDAHRQATATCFDLGARTVEKYKIYPTAADGYYVMLPPLKPGKHVLNFGGASSTNLQAITYNLDVE